MKALIQTGSSGRVPVPPEKRFLINEFESQLRNEDTAVCDLCGRVADRDAMTKPDKKGLMVCDICRADDNLTVDWDAIWQQKRHIEKGDE